MITEQPKHLPATTKDILDLCEMVKNLKEINAALLDQIKMTNQRIDLLHARIVQLERKP